MGPRLSSPKYALLRVLRKKESHLANSQKTTATEMELKKETPLDGASVADAAAVELQCVGKSEAGEDNAGLDGVKTSADTAEGAPGPSGIEFVLLFVCLLMGNFLVGYDSSCIGTLTPVITDQFNALGDIGWYQTAYLLTLSAPMLVFGQLYSFFSMKTLYLISVIIFAAGSALTAAAPVSVAFIIGRAINGLGAAGINSGISIIISHTTSLERRPMYFALCGAIECAALAFGPLISGAIAHSSTWRVSFYATIPIAALVLIAVFFSMSHVRKSSSQGDTAGRAERLRRIDWTGFVVEVSMTVSLVLALQWGGTIYLWGNWRVILLLALAGVLAGTFFFVEYRSGDKSMVPLTLLRRRTVAFACLTVFCNFASLWVMSFYLPLYFQAVRGATTLESGVMYLPLAVSMSIAALAGGPMTTLLGYYSPILILGCSLAAVGIGLMSTFTPYTGAARWIGYQIVYGAGIGLAFQPPFIAVQTVLEESVVPMALVLLGFSQILGGIVFLSVAQNVFLHRLTRDIPREIPGVNAGILGNGALGLVNAVPTAYRKVAIRLYNGALVEVFFVALGLACVAVVSSLGIEYRSVKKGKRP